MTVSGLRMVGSSSIRYVHAVGDFNGDGMPDVVGTIEDDITRMRVFKVLTNDGAANFRVSSSVALFEAFYSTKGIHAADFDGDGRVDLIVVRSSSTIYCLRGKGDGTFEPVVTKSLSSSNFSETSIGDFNGDGVPDLLAEDSRAWEPYINRGAFTFESAGKSTVGNRVDATLVADIDGDGRDEIVALVDNALQYVNTTRTGALATPVVVNGQIQYPCALVDVDGNESVDIVTKLPDNLTLRVYLNRGDGRFGEPATITLPEAHLQVIAGDVSRDGRVDLVMDSGTGFAVMYGLAGGAFTPPVKIDSETMISPWKVADFNGDGTNDILGMTTANRYPALFIMGRGSKVELLSNHDYARDAAVHRFDRDGLTDCLVVYDRPTPVLRMFSGQRDGSFALSSEEPIGSDPQSIGIGDFDADGWWDCAVSNGSAGSVTILVNQRNGRLRAAAGLGAPGVPRDLIVSDLDGDQLLDLAVALVEGNGIAIFYGEGGASFSPAFHVAVSGSYSVAAADVDGDARNDLIVGTLVDGMSVFSNLGGRVFEKKSTASINGYVEALAAVDFDEDDRIEVVAAIAGTTSRILMYRVGIDGGLTALQEWPYVPGAMDVRACDINGDARMDFLAVPNESRWISLFLNDGTGAFIETQVATSVGHSRVRAGDMNNDHRPEIVAVGAPGVSIVETTATCFSVRRGDADANGRLTIVDAIVIVRYAYAGKAIACTEAADLNEDGSVNVADAVGLLRGLFDGAPLGAGVVSCPAS